MIDKDKIFVCIKGEEVIISYDGKKLIKPKNKFVNMSKDDIKEWYIREVISIKEVT